MRISDWSSDVCSSDLRGYKVENIPLVPESPPPAILFNLSHPLIVGLTTSPDRLVQVRRNRLLALKQAPETAYVDPEKVTAELAFARRLFSDTRWPLLVVTRRSTAEYAADIMQLCLDWWQAHGSGGR